MATAHLAGGALSGSHGASHECGRTGGTVGSTVVVAMDGTSGSGKSSASRGVARRLGLRYLDTGAMYRAMTWQMLVDGVDVDDAVAVASHAHTADIGIGTSPELPTITLGGVDVAREIRSDAAT